MIAALAGEARQYVACDLILTAGGYLVSNSDYERPAYTVVNLNIGLTRGPVDLSFFVRNLFDNDAIIQRPLQLFVQQGLRVRPRTLGVSGTVKF